MHPVLVEFAAKMAARCRTKLPSDALWSVAMGNASGFDGERGVRIRITLDGRVVRGELREGVALNEPERIDYHVDRMWDDFMRYLRPPASNVSETLR
jgi:hypothetical protein